MARVSLQTHPDVVLYCYKKLPIVAAADGDGDDDARAVADAAAAVNSRVPVAHCRRHARRSRDSVTDRTAGNLTVDLSID